MLTLLLFLFILSAFFSASETAIFSLNLVDVEILKQRGRAGRMLYYLRKNPEKTLVMVLVMNNIVNVALSSLSTLMATEKFGDVYIGLVLGILTFMLVTFSEILPKTLAVRYSEYVGLYSSYVLYPLQYILYPVIVFYEFIIKSLHRKGDFSENITEEEINMTLTLGANHGVLDEREMRLIKNTLNFDKLKIREIMIDRANVYILDQDMRVGDAIDQAKKTPYSRFPVTDIYDSVVGFVLLRDLINVRDIDQRNSIKDLNIARRPVYLDINTNPVNALKRMLRSKTHISIVLKKGKFVGMLTLEDLIEEILGEIHDEYDHNTKLVPLNGILKDS